MNDVVCSFIGLHNQNNETLTSTLNLTKKKDHSIHRSLSIALSLLLEITGVSLDKKQRKDI